MTPLQTFADRCSADLPGMPAPMLNRLIVEIGRELCRVGRLWRYTTPDIELIAPTDQNDTGVYALTLPTDQAVIHDIDGVTIDGNPIDPLGRGATRIPNTTRWTRLDDNNLMIRPDPGSGTLVVDVVLMPIPDARELPNLLYIEWVEAVQHGVNAKGMAQPKKEWSDPNGTLSNQGMWMSALAKARSYGRGGGATQRRRTIDGFNS